jgi:NAD(P)-dependent dehydrogenase (short-subunit alcohol dehydrogenase family)
MSHFTIADVPNQAGKCIIVTGANTGLGFEAARILAARGARVLLACRSEDKARAAMARIAAETPRADLAFLPLDQADLGSVRAAAELAAKEPRIDALINNAGVMMPPLSRTAQGFELQLGVNHLGTFALTGLLLPKMAQNPGSRVVVTASLAHKNGKIDFDDLQAEKSYSRMKRYADSKLANMLHFTELDRRLRAAGMQVSAMGCHPGMATTDLGRHMGPLGLMLMPLGLVMNSAEQGAYPTLQAATDPAASGGDYFGPQGWFEARGGSGKASRTQQSHNAELGQRLWEVSVELTGVDPGI